MGVATVLVLSMLAAGAQEASPSVDAALEIHHLDAMIAIAADGERLPLLERRVQLDGADGRWWEELARARFAQDEPVEAVAALRQAIDLGAVGRAEGECTIARWFAEVDPEAAATALRRCVDLGYRFVPRLVADPTLKELLARQEFAELLGDVDPSICEGSDGREIDLDHLVREIKRLHWLYRSRPLPRRTQRLISDLRARQDDLPDTRFIIELQRILASLGDGHSVLYPIGMKTGRLNRMPIGLWIFEDGLFVVQADPPFEHLIGQEVLSIGGLTPQVLVERIAEFASHDNPSGLQWVAPVYLTFPDFLEAVGADLESGVVLRDAASQVETVAVAGTPAAPDPDRLVLSLPPLSESPLYLSRPREPFWSTTLDGQIHYVQINRIRGTGEAGFEQFAAELHQGLQEDDDAALIVDLRHNAGGDAGLLPELVRTLVSFDQKAKNRLYVLISRNTFSAAQTLINDLERLTSAVVIGEPSGTRPNRLGNEAPIILPCSGAVGSLSSGYNQAATSRDERIWTAPDIPVGVTSSDYFSGRDPVLEVALHVAQ